MKLLELFNRAFQVLVLKNVPAVEVDRYRFWSFLRLVRCVRRRLLCSFVFAAFRRTTGDDEHKRQQNDKPFFHVHSPFLDEFV
ncbi:hypothetical protein D3C84_1180720 [compost metagenome]